MLFDTASEGFAWPTAWPVHLASAPSQFSSMLAAYLVSPVLPSSVSVSALRLLPQRVSRGSLLRLPPAAVVVPLSPALVLALLLALPPSALVLAVALALSGPPPSRGGPSAHFYFYFYAASANACLRLCVSALPLRFLFLFLFRFRIRCLFYFYFYFCSYSHF